MAFGSRSSDYSYLNYHYFRGFLIIYWFRINWGDIFIIYTRNIIQLERAAKEYTDWRESVGVS